LNREGRLFTDLHLRTDRNSERALTRERGKGGKIEGDKEKGRAEKKDDFPQRGKKALRGAASCVGRAGYPEKVVKRTGISPSNQEAFGLVPVSTGGS